jgi:hypothetical protein
MHSVRCASACAWYAFMARRNRSSLLPNARFMLVRLMPIASVRSEREVCS